MIRAIRLELAKPISESWDTAGPLLRMLAAVTPKLLNAAMDTLIAVDVVQVPAVKAAVAPDARGVSPEALAYQAVNRTVENLREWAVKKGGKKRGEPHPWALLEVPGGMASAISRAAKQAHARRDQERAHFGSERILVRAAETTLSADDHGIALTIKLRIEGRVRFAVRHSWGTHRETLDQIVSGAIPHGDCKLQFDDRHKKWFALLSYEASVVEHPGLDPAHVLIVHRGIRNALYLLCSTGERAPALLGGKFSAQRRRLQARTRDVRRTSAAERGEGAKGHGRARRYETYDALGDKLARVTHTFCQQAAAHVAETAIRLGCGTVVIEDYGGIEPDDDPALRRVLDRFPLYELKQCVASRLERDGIALQETPSAYISSTCPRCGEQDTRAHNTRTNVFHCRQCGFERPADWVASYWMGKHFGADMSAWDERLKRERALADSIQKETANEQETTDGSKANDIREAGRGMQATAGAKRARGSRVLCLPDGRRTRA